MGHPVGERWTKADEAKLSEAERAELAAARAAPRGQGRPWAEVKAEMDAKRYG